jgi:hypothetical protein
MSLDRLSLATVPITPLFNDTALPEATGFVWKRNNRFYLITNWHVASATHLFTKTLLLKGGARPNKLKCHFIIRVGEYDRDYIDVPLRDDNDNPLWLIHPLQDGRPVDIAAIPLHAEELQKRVTLLPLNELAPARLAIMVGMEVFILEQVPA